MSESTTKHFTLPPEQRAIRDKCFHPAGNYIEFKKQDIEQSIPMRFEEMVRAYPSRLAVKTKTQALTYQALNHMANRVARAITAVCGQGNEPIVLLLNHDIALIAAILGVLKSGNIYVSLEPSQASARTGYILEDTGTRLIVTNNRSFSEAKNLACQGCHILNIDEIDTSLSTENIGCSLPPDALASIMYTSGSTGPPKGVVQNHRNVLHSCKSYTNGFHISIEDRLTLLHSCSFNGSAYNLFGALLNGAALFPLDVRQEGVHRLVNWLEQNEITIYHSSPTTFRNALQDFPGGERIPNLRLVHLSGAAVSNVDVELYKNYCCPNCILVHRMGVTETGTIRWYFIDKMTSIGGNRVPIGYPADHKEALILDDAGEEISDNRAGEIAIKSRYLSLGYWRKPHLTQARFLPDPNGGDRRIYLTGDLGRMAADGCLVHLGRNDYRVKVRGFSVGVGEIESALLEHRGIHDAVVVGRESPFGDKRLVAYLVQDERRAVTVTELRDFLQARLPDYMIPSTFVTLSELPLTPNGKVDRTALPVPGVERPNLATPFAEPGTPIEKALARIWAGILSLDRVGIRDNFFDLGGHSLAATRVVSHVIKQFQLEIPLQSLFESPTVSDMAAVITNNQERKLNGEDGGVSGVQAYPVQPTPKDRELPLSFAQQRLWFLHQLEPDSPVYNQSKALRLRGQLNRQALQQALDTIVERHEVLRTTFSSCEGKPTQVVHEPGSVELRVISLQGVPTEQREETLHRTLRDFIRRPFDLAKDWPLRATLIHCADQEHIILLVTHHIASDGWSNDILFRELSTLYEAFCQGRVSPLTDLPIQYVDYALWQREWLQGEVLQQQISYWQKQLAGVSPLELPTDHPRPITLGHLGQAKTFKFSRSLVNGLKRITRQEHATLFITLLAAFQTLLHRYSGQDDIAVGSPIAGRTREEFEGLIGFFVNTLVLRNDFSGHPTFLELLHRVKNNAVDAYSHQDVPFEKLVEEIRPERDLGHNPFFQVNFQLRNYPTSAVTLGQLNIEEYEFVHDIAKFDLSVALRDDGTGLTGSVEYNTDLFDASTIERLVGHFQTLLEGIVANPDHPIGELPLLTEAEKHQLLVEWNGIKTEYPKDKCIHELFEAQVEKSSDDIAIVLEDKRVTYRELNSRADQLAHYLQKLGVGPETLVGLCLERSIDMIVAMLAILKAGGAYLPLDPAYPTDRLKFMIEDSNASIILTQTPLASLLPAAKARIVFLDEQEWQAITPDLAHQADLTVQLSPNHTAYVIYTSGSTGTPKGTQVSHYNVVRLFQATEAWFGFNSSDCWTLFHSYAFDFSVWEIWGALLHGGKLVIVPQEITRSPQEFAALLIRHQVTVLNQTPSAFRQLAPVLTSDNGQDSLALRCVIFGGEALELQSLNPWFDRFGENPPKLINMYGITETTVHVTYRPITRADAASGSGSVIGKPIPDLRVYLLDRHHSLVPIGVAGEIYVGGAGVAKGYLGRSGLTAERFVIDPFSENPQAKLYRSGDLARWLPNGELEYLGRIDNQVKIRGFRIELGEIEAVLAQHPSIKQAVLLAREDTPGDTRVVAYVVAGDGATISIPDLRRFLQDKLPEYMVPSAFVFLDSLELTPNGKLDRKSLPAPDHNRPELDDAFAAPTTPVEEILATIWSEVLKLDKPGIHDNFFYLGGHSLLATQVVSRINTSFQIDLPLRRLFESPTIAGLADSVQANMAIEKDSRSVRSIASVPRSNHTPLSFAQERFWFLEHLQPNNPAYKTDYCFRISGRLNVAVLEQSLAEIVRRHESLRTTFHDRGGAPVQEVSEPRRFHLEIIDLQDDNGLNFDSKVEDLIDKGIRHPFDLSTDLLLRGTVLRLNDCEHVLLISSHHIAWDHWSIGLFFRELSALYRAFAAAKPSPLAELPIQYKHFAMWQRKLFQGAEFYRDLAYWKKQLAGAPASLNLPTDRPRQPLHHRRGGRHSITLSKQLKNSLDILSKTTGVSAFMTLLAAFQMLLYRWTGQEDIVVGTPVAGRDRVETENLIGLFLNSLALRTDLSGNPTLLQLLNRVREVALEAYDHQALPFEKLVEELQAERDVSSTPIFQVFINMYNFKEAGFELDGLSVSSVKKPGEAAPQFDLEFYIREHADGTHLSFVYDTDLFEAATIERMLGHFQTLLEGIVANPDQRIGELPLLTEAEKHQILVEWNDTKTDYPRDKCIQTIFEKQVERSPDAVAVVFEDQQLSYWELNSRANQLARYLQNLGVGPEVLVAICLGRSIEMVVGLLGILKAGGAYVPLDPDYPQERLQFMLRDAQVRVLLTQEKFLSDIDHRTAVCLDRDWPNIAAESTDNAQSRVAAGNLAYVIYTSGSTGQPKGVAVEHHQLSHYLSSITDRLDLTSSKSFATVSTLAADLGNTVIFSSLCSGAALHVLSRDRVTDADAMADYFSRHTIDCLKIVPSHLAALQSVSRPEAVLPRKLLILGGEASGIDWVKRLASLAPDCRIVNHYGPTETTVGVMTYEVEMDSLPFGPAHLPLGRPLANTEIYILDQNLNPVPISVPGEIYIGGQGLARGYLNRPELTQEKFVADPFSAEPGARLYKTGDRARYLADGNVEFLGRMDNQIKLRGYRIEPGEIEAALKQHPDVREALVLARPGANGDKQLAAYVVATPERAPLIAGQPRYQLPNGTAVAQLNKNETDYIYQEIFERQAYLKHGITIDDGDCIFDVGANIGLFTLFANQIAQSPKVYAFEPNPAVFEILQANAKLAGSAVKLFNCGLADRAGNTSFTFFPGFSLLSGFYADAQAEKQVVKTFMLNQQKAGVGDMTELVEQADSILAERFAAQTFSAELRTLSSIMEQERIESIDLLKINVEKSELDVLNGIKDQDWPKIKQLVVEVDVKENLPTITSLLETRGYEYVVEQDNLLAGTSLCYVYAIRPTADRRLIREQTEGTCYQAVQVGDQALLSAAELREFLAAKLPEHMIPTAYWFLDALPLTANGKVDRQALLALALNQTDPDDRFTAPRTHMEEIIANIWAEILKLAKVGIHENFFHLGGHSLLATQVVSRIRDAFKLDLPLRTLFEAPTIEGLARRLHNLRDKQGVGQMAQITPAAREQYRVQNSSDQLIDNE